MQNCLGQAKMFDSMFLFFYQLLATKIYQKKTNLRWTRRMKCCGGTKARSMSTNATTIFLASFLKLSNAVDAIATTFFKERNSSNRR